MIKGPPARTGPLGDFGRSDPFDVEQTTEQREDTGAVRRLRGVLCGHHVRTFLSGVAYVSVRVLIGGPPGPDGRPVAVRVLGGQGWLFRGHRPGAVDDPLI